jgi:hypothetical protein
MKRHSCKVLNTSTQQWCADEARVLLSYSRGGESVESATCIKHGIEIAQALQLQGVYVAIDPIPADWGDPVAGALARGAN